MQLPSRRDPAFTNEPPAPPPQPPPVVTSLIPADGWFAIFRSNGGLTAFRLPLVGWAILSVNGHTGIVPMVCDATTGVISPAQSVKDFDCLEDPDSTVYMNEDDRTIVIERQSVEIRAAAQSPVEESNDEQG